MYAVQITAPAIADIQRIFIWWAENRSRDEAVLWYEKILAAISTLARMPERCPPVPELRLSITGVRQLSFGVGTRSTHRIIFIVEDETVSILRVRHHAQDDIEL